MADGVGRDARLDGAKLRRRRIEARLTRPELARRAGVTRAFIWQLETGVSGASAPKIGAIADALPDCKITDLLADGALDDNGGAAA